MATVTAQQLIADGLGRADMIDSVTAFIDHPTTAGTGFDAFTLLNAAVSELFDILYESEESSYASVRTAFSTVNNQEDYAILTIAGATFYHLRAIEMFNGIKWNDLPLAQFTERNDFPVANIPMKFLLNGDNITLLPVPNAIYQMRIIFVPNPPVLAADIDTIDLKGPWREYIATHFAEAAKLKEESDATALTSKKLSLEQRIRSASKKRDVSHPQSPSDVVGDSFDTFQTYPGGRIF